MSNPLVSVCIPVYNGGHCISQTIKNVLEQTFEDFELIIVNDNSKDNTEEVVRSFTDNRIKYYKNSENIGMVPNWNKSVCYASGKFIKLLCADDLIEKNCLELQSNALKDNPKVVLVTCNTNVIDSNNNILMLRKNFKREGLYNGTDVAKKSLINGQNMFGESSVVMYRRDILILAGNYDNDFWYSPDWDFSIRTLYYGDLYFIDKVLASFRLSPTSQTSKIIFKNKLIIMREDMNFMRKQTIKFRFNPFQLAYHYMKTAERLMLKSIYLRYVLNYNIKKGNLIHATEIN